MVFSSITFLYYFLPAVLLIYYAVPFKLKNSVLLLFSLAFYAWGEPRYIFIMLATIVTGYIAGILIEKFQGQIMSKVCLILSIVLFVGVLFVFKYYDFIVGGAGKITGQNVTLLKLVLPVGISFYTFQIISYTIDVYRGEVKAQKNFVSLATYISMFPQLIAGPIVRYSDIERQLKKRNINIDGIADGVRRFITGLCKKVLIANSMGEFITIFRESSEPTVLFYWLYAIACTLQIYFDFSGYSDMAIGLGKMLGFEFMENFNYPYISKSITEFWRRWHISLGGWFRDYVYIPLGGNKKGFKRQIFNIFAVWLLTGLWHGAAVNFILWGLLYAIILVAEKRILLKKRIPAFVGHFYTMFSVIMGFVLFSANSMNEVVEDIKSILGLSGIAFANESTLYYLKSYGVLFVTAIIFCVPIIPWLKKKAKSKRTTAVIMDVISTAFCVLGLIVVTAYLVDGSFNPFLYFRF